MDTMTTLVKNVSTVTFDDLTPEAVEAAKKSILDTVGVTIAGSSVEGCQILAEHVKELGGPPESSIAVFGGKAPAYLAAQVNGAMARALEIDDVSDEFVIHPSVSIVPACLAAAERTEGVNGKELITAMALGQDIMFRMAAATKLSAIISGRYNFFRVFASTGAVGKLMRLSEDQLRNAEGIAFSQMSGDGQSARDGVMSHYIQSGTVAKSALEAVLMARKGIIGAKNILEGPSGYFVAIEPDPNLDALTFELGETFRGAETCIKPYTSCRQTHEAIDLVIAIRKETGITLNQIAEITVHVNDQCYNLVCNPLEQKRRPQSMVDAQFSLPYTVAAAFAKGDIFIDEVSEQTIKDPDILSLLQRITPLVDERCQTELVLGSVTMEVITRDGRTIFKETRIPRGNYQNPLSMNDLVYKFKKCASHAARKFPDDQLDKILEFLCDLENVKDVTEITELLVPHPMNGM
ncbi:MmgE/PrpD family protein [Thermodesulfobacteriota bacterium]